MTWLEATGILSYHDSGWIVINTDRDLIKYYRKLGELGHLQYPKYGAHITVVNGKHITDPTDHPAWMRYEGEEVEFEYSINVKGGLHHGCYWITIRCEFADHLLKELNLQPPKWPFHITLANYNIGKLHYN